MSPTALSLRELRRRGYLADTVTRWIERRKIRLDLFGFGDILALRDGDHLIVQATSGDNVAARVTKIRSHRNARRVLESGMRVAVWGWALQGPRGKRKVNTLREVPIELGDLTAAATAGSILPPCSQEHAPAPAQDDHGSTLSRAHRPTKPQPRSACGGSPSSS